MTCLGYSSCFKSLWAALRPKSWQKNKCFIIRKERDGFAREQEHIMVERGGLETLQPREKEYFSLPWLRIANPR